MVPSNTRRLTFVVLSKKSLTSELIVITFGTDIHVPWTSWYCFTRRGIVGFLGCGLVLRTVEPLTVHILVLSESCSLFEQHIIFHSGYRCGLQCLFYWERYSGVSVKDTAHGTWAGLEWCGSLSCLCVGPTGLSLCHIMSYVCISKGLRLHGFFLFCFVYHIQSHSHCVWNGFQHMLLHHACFVSVWLPGASEKVHYYLFCECLLDWNCNLQPPTWAINSLRNALSAL